MKSKTKVDFRSILVALPAYVVFVIYGSLVPLDFVSMPFDRAWAIFKDIRMLDLGVESRADWVANGVLYFPLGFLGSYILRGFSRIGGVAAAVTTIVLAMLLAVSIEFAQIFFPPRTVSLNDLLAEALGTGLGILVAIVFSGWFNKLENFRTLKIEQSGVLLLQGYMFLYVAFSLFPFDFLVSLSEIHQKLLSAQWGWLLAGTSHGLFLKALKLLFEVLSVIPVGILLNVSLRGKSDSILRPVLSGALLGAVIELAQLFMSSGVTEGISVLSRSVGVLIGCLLWKTRRNIGAFPIGSFIRRHGNIIISIYLLLLLGVNGLYGQQWMGIDFAIDQVQKLHFVPFYYHYFTSESKALFSVVAVCVMYLPVGILALAYRSTLGQALVGVILLAGFVEFLKLFLVGGHPDPTNVMLSLGITWAVYYFFGVFDRLAGATPSSAIPTPVPSDNEFDRRDIHRSIAAGAQLRGIKNNPAILPAVLAAIFVFYEILNFPTRPLILGVVFGIYAWAIWRTPVAIVGSIAAALPILDIAPWSGRWFLDEFDLMIVLSLSIGYARISPKVPNGRTRSMVALIVGGLVAMSFLIGVLNSVLPWPAIDQNSFTNYYSPFNALRIAKGALWALLIIGLVRRMLAAQFDVAPAFSMGMVVGLAFVVAAVVWERLAFSGLFNFSGDYRVTGPFSSMHTGGAYIECFLALATPFLVLHVVRDTNWITRLLGAGLLLATTYCLMVTFSRNGYFAYGVALAVVLFFSLFKSSARLRRPGLLVVPLALAMLAVAVPIFTGEFAQKRIATVTADLKVRQAHWNDALDIRKNDLFTTVFGMGIGRYPESHYLLSREGNRSGTYQLVSEAGQDYLRLAAGDSIYVEQMVDLEPRQKYTIKFDVRTDQPNGKINIPICEKWMLTSFNCIWSWSAIGEPGVWHHIELPIQTDRLNTGNWYSRRTTKLALFNGNGKGVVDIDNVVLESEQGRNLLQNGDFSSEMDHWYFAADSHLQWHIKSLPVALLFDQGWFGLIALGIFSLVAVGIAARQAWAGNLDSAALLAAFCGFLVVGLFDTLIDAPRFLMLFLLLGSFCWITGATNAKGRAV